MEPTDLTEAAQAPNVPGALQALLLSRIKTPQQSQEIERGRAGALKEYQGALRSEPMGSYTPTMHSMYSHIGNIGKMSPFGALASGVSAGGDMLGKIQEAKMKNNVSAAKIGYEDYKDRDKLDTQELGMLRTLGGSGSGGGYIHFKDDAGNTYILNKATGEKSMIPATLSGQWDKVQRQVYEKLVAEGGISNEEAMQRSVEQANRIVGQAPGKSTLTMPSVTAGQIKVAPQEVPGMFSVTGLPGLGEREQPAQPSAKVASVTPGAAQTPYFEDKPEKERRKEFTVGMEKSALKDYDDIKLGAQAASDMLNTLSVLKQIPRTQDALAPWREKLGSGLHALGMDGNIVREAENLQQVRPLLAKIANNRLLLAKGVQTEGDAQRAYNEFLKITDTQKAADFMYAWAEELANRDKFKKQVYDLASKETGSMKNGDSYWQQTDYAKSAPVAMLSGKPWTFTKWRDAFLKANPEASPHDAVKAWKQLSGGVK